MRKVIAGEDSMMNSKQQQISEMSEISATLYFNIDALASYDNACIEMSSFIFGVGDVIYGKKMLIENGNEANISMLAADLLQLTIDRSPPSLLSSIRKRGIVISGKAIPDDMAIVLQQATDIHASTVMEASDVEALSICQAWLKSRDVK